DGKRPNHMALFRQLKDTGWAEPGWNDTGWKGCVEARAGAYNISDTPPDPAKPDTLFVPYFAPDDPGDAQMPSSSYGNEAKYYNNSYLSDASDTVKLDKQ
ncbi:hypothetical protein EN801_047195, partial [Mesorhizobium sp. M00.F.Ca.ET.158.01.1.1]